MVEWGRLNVTEGEMLEILARQFVQDGHTRDEWNLFFLQGVAQDKKAKAKAESFRRSGYEILDVTAKDIDPPDWRTTKQRILDMYEAEASNG